MNLEHNFDLKTGRRAELKCIEVTWDKVESGECFVKYDVGFKNESGHYLYNKTGHNVGAMTVCNLTAYTNVTHVELRVSFREESKNVTAEVSEIPVLLPTTGKTCTLQIARV